MHTVFFLIAILNSHYSIKLHLSGLRVGANIYWHFFVHAQKILINFFHDTISLYWSCATFFMVLAGKIWSMVYQPFKSGLMQILYIGNHTFPIGLAWRVLSHLLLKVKKLQNCRHEMYGIKQIIIQRCSTKKYL